MPPESTTNAPVAEMAAVRNVKTTEYRMGMVMVHTETHGGMVKIVTPQVWYVCIMVTHNGFTHIFVWEQ